MLPPVVTIVSPENNDLVSARQVTINFKVRNPSGESITGIRALVDGRPVTTDKDGEIRGSDSISVPIPPQDTEVAIIAENGAVVFTSSTGRQYSLENEDWGNGAFTKALVEGLIVL